MRLKSPAEPSAKPALKAAGGPSVKPALKPAGGPSARQEGERLARFTDKPAGELSAKPSAKPADGPSAKPAGGPSGQESLFILCALGHEPIRAGAILAAASGLARIKSMTFRIDGIIFIIEIHAFP
jgi:hypothetical protein